MAARTWLAEPHEAEVVARLLVGFRDWLGHDWPSDNAFLASIERLMDGRDAEFLLGAATDDSPPGGVCQVRFRFSVWTASPDCWLEDLFVAQAARGAGLGTALVEAACGRARERGCRRIELDVNEANAPAVALYERLGFSGASKGKPERDLFMGRPLTDPG